MEIISGYRDDFKYRSMLNDLMMTVFGFSFEYWYSLGKWDDRYNCYSVFDGDRIISNIGVQKYDLLVKGRSVQAIQLGAVATREEYRGRGLSRMLMEMVLSIYSDKAAFLFGDESALEYYPKFGFERINEIQPYVNVAPSGIRSRVVKISSDSDILYRLLENRTNYSRRVDVTNASAVNLFNIIMRFKDDIYYIPEYDAVLIATKDGNKADVWDLICSGEISLEGIVQHLPFFGIDIIEFGFTPDWITDDYSARSFDRYDTQGYLFVRDIDPGDGFKFPSLAIT